LKKTETRSSIGLNRLNHHFSASHFIRTNEFNESIHGHNYYVELELSGFLGLDGLIHDYLIIDKILKNIIIEWDHYVLLPNENKAVQIDKKQNNFEIIYDNRFYSIPSDEIRFLNCVNITTENLVKILANKLNDKLRALKMLGNITSIQIKIWETPTYFASHTIQL
jgi:6-pyruvoyltetrahydropterin/6-carboxytetrahydropterin synthase